MGNKKILIIDDDEKLQKLLKEYLEGHGYRVISLMDENEAETLIEKEAPGIVILDVMLPNIDGFEILKAIRRSSSIPVIMLTARGEETDRIVGLELGADDYLPKPFNPRELLARIKAVTRRFHPEEPRAGTITKSLINAGGLTLDRSKHLLIKDDKKITLSTTEFRILDVMMTNPDTVLSRDQLMQLASGRDIIAFDRSIDVHISKLRAKVESVSGLRDQIRTVWGSGYMFVDKL